MKGSEAGRPVTSTGTAFVFPGQGSQGVGMGAAVAARYAVARETFEEADESLGFPLSRLCFEGPLEDLTLTANTQPAILTVSVAIDRTLASLGVRPACAAGHSLGEYSALVAAGVLTFRDAVRAVRLRGSAMQEAVPPGDGAMAAIVGLDAPSVSEICRLAAHGEVVSPANFNSPEQIVIAGARSAVERASHLALERGAKRAIPLAVSAPFHCSLMNPAAERLAAHLEGVRFSDPAFAVVTNVDARPIETGAAARDALIRQVSAPVRWVESVRRLQSLGARRFVEIGPGRVLTGLLRRIDRAAELLGAEDPDTIAALAAGVLGAGGDRTAGARAVESA